MPIYKGSQQINPTDIFVGDKPLQRVYVGDKLVWQKVSGPVITAIKYGLLYNPLAAVDARQITSSDNWTVPSQADRDILVEYTGGASVGGGKLKETGLTYFNTPNTGATNEFNFNGRGAGQRGAQGTDGSFLNLNGSGTYITRTLSGSNYYHFQISYTSASYFLSVLKSTLGASIRLCREATESELLLADGTACTPYIGNDGKIYRTVKIGTQVWLADNLAETKFRNGDWIPGFDSGVYTPFTNEAWAALTTAGMCAYNDDLTNV